MIGSRSVTRSAIIRRLQSVKTQPTKVTKRIGNISQFQHEKTGDFHQSRPVLHNPFTTDEFLNDYLLRYCPESRYEKIKSDLVRFGDRIVSEVDQLGIECEENPPRLERTDAWGKRVDRIWTTPAWKGQHKVSAEEGLIAIGYENESGSFGRVHQMIKNLMYGASSGLYNCPLAMTDGAAMISRDLQGDYPVLKNAHDHLTSRDPDQFWTSGQWMTEKEGGSDVGSATDTHALPIDESSYELFGYKWFTSAITSDMTLTLARIHDEDGNIIPGSRGLSMFYLELRNENGDLNNIQVHKLKNKLGTRQLPTAELNLNGTIAQRIGNPGQGIKIISGMLTITRIHNAIAACSFMRRVNHLARDYAKRRTAFGCNLDQQVAHVSVLARLDIESRAAILLSLEVSRLLGRIEVGEATENEKNIMRILTPLAKLVTGKQTVAVCSEGLECFGGQGYIEDTHLPQLLRDSQVLPIWEGTSTVMSLDVLRAIQKSKGNVLNSLFNEIRTRLTSLEPEFNEAAKNIQRQMDSLTKYIVSAEKTENFQMKSARDFSFAIGRLYQAVLLVDHAAWSGKETDIYAANHFAKTKLVELQFDYSQEAANLEYNLVYANYDRK